MEQIQLTINYGGALVEASTIPEDNCKGTIYPVEMDGKYCFTLYMTDAEDWAILREADATIPFVENDLLEKIIKKLQYELRYAA